ncbi:hypothetical protein CAEBREN_15539 [Caenorhabditis brenneri]|uniref:F-box domain-containing protein n=1 Tax=Caenorhabditis brenneri TaxID=135651 RepID=G0P3G1_CAEBE|nr:hypothetical protein CAEBREN_15539 [Caenorhabditis brenneri]
MSEVFQTNDVVFRACVLYETLHGKSVEEAYENMKKVKPNVEYSDFEYWYFRFSNGRHELNHDRSTDPSLADMPTNVMEKIFEHLDLMDKLCTRKVCRKLRAVIDDQASSFDGEIEIRITGKICKILYQSDEIKYSAQENGNYLLETPRKKISLKDSLQDSDF